LFIELYKHKERIAKYSKVDEQTLLGMLEIILSKIQFIPISMLSKTSRKLAYDLCKDIDEKDSVFVALTLEYHGLLWTGDKKLISGLKEKGFNRFFQI
jgi:predicted nucleic acid-binding protein